MASMAGRMEKGGRICSSEKGRAALNGCLENASFPLKRATAWKSEVQAGEVMELLSLDKLAVKVKIHSFFNKELEHF